MEFAHAWRTFTHRIQLRHAVLFVQCRPLRTLSPQMDHGVSFKQNNAGLLASQRRFWFYFSEWLFWGVVREAPHRLHFYSLPPSPPPLWCCPMIKKKTNKKQITPSLHFLRQGSWGGWYRVVVLKPLFAIHTVVCKVCDQIPRIVARNTLKRNLNKVRSKLRVKWVKVIPHFSSSSFAIIINLFKS